MRVDLAGNRLEPGGIYRMLTGGNALVVEILPDGDHFAPVPSFFAGFFRITTDPIRLSTLAGHCNFAPFTPDHEV